MNSSLLAIQSQYWAVRDYLSPVLRESKFKEHGRITPEEFVAAGDFLTFKFPVWQWEKGDPSRARDFLPADKQYLITRNVPCLRRATAINYTDDDEDKEQLMNFLEEADVAQPDDEWVATHVGRKNQGQDTIQDIPDIGDSPHLNAATAGLHIGDDDAIPDMDDIPDMDEAAGLEEEDDAAVVAAPSSNLLQVRTYDCYISYDKHYQTPRFWLFGYDEHKRPLTSKEIFQDVPADHAFKTMTMEVFPHSGAQLASVHPCRHASVMKKFIDRMEESQEDASSAGEGSSAASGKKSRWLGGVMRKVTGGDKDKAAAAVAAANGDEEPRGVQVDFYLVIFLKFIASIVPTIEVDSTTATSF